jgi:transposase
LIGGVRDRVGNGVGKVGQFSRSRFTSSKAVGAAFGLTPRRQQSGEIDRIS